MDEHAISEAVKSGFVPALKEITFFREQIGGWYETAVVLILLRRDTGIQLEVKKTPPQAGRHVWPCFSSAASLCLACLTSTSAEQNAPIEAENTT
jgi:hypothetical protein